VELKVEQRAAAALRPPDTSCRCWSNGSPSETASLGALEVLNELNDQEQTKDEDDGDVRQAERDERAEHVPGDRQACEAHRPSPKDTKDLSYGTSVS